MKMIHFLYITMHKEAVVVGKKRGQSHRLVLRMTHITLMFYMVIRELHQI